MIIRPIITLWIMIPLTLFLALLIFVNNRGMKLIIRGLFLILLFVINLRIMIPNGKTLVYGNDLDIIFIVDSTLSMAAEDVSPTRLDQVKKDINYILDNTVGASYSVISFDIPGASNNWLRIPMTKDADTALASVEAITPPQELYSRGSRVTDFKETLKEALEREKKREGHKVIVYLFTDGETTNTEKAEEDLSDLKKGIDGGAVLGYGTSKGGRMKVKDYNEEYKYLTYWEGYKEEIAVSKIDENNLKKIAGEMGLEYIHMTSTKEIDHNLKGLNSLKKTADVGEEKYSYKDTYYFLTPVIGILILIELFDLRRIRL